MNNVPAIRVPSTREVDMHARLATKYIPSPSGCWIWVAAVDGKGYGLVRQPGYKSMRPAHRVAYELAHGEIPAGLHIDHLCRQKKCVNPQHLDAVTNRTNVLRAGNPGARICRVLDGRQSRRTPDRVVLAEVGLLLGDIVPEQIPPANDSESVA